MQEIIKINQTENGDIRVSARELHGALEIRTRFSLWAEQNFKNLIENIDYTTVVTTTQVQNNGGIQYRELKDYSLTVDAAKQIAMMSGTDKGREVRLYFIQVEKAWNSPDQIMARALQISQHKLEHKDKLIAEMQPKALFADAVSASNSTILIGELAKILKQNGIDIGGQRLFKWLRDNGYLIKRKGTDFNTPTQRSMQLGLFRIKESTHLNSSGANITSKTTKVTGKGQQYFIDKFLNDEIAVI